MVVVVGGVFFPSALPAGVPTWRLIEGLTGGGVG